jgi:hypothetical protein
MGSSVGVHWRRLTLSLYSLCPTYQTQHRHQYIPIYVAFYPSQPTYTPASLNNAMSREAIAKNNAGAFTGAVSAAASSDPTGIGAIVHYVAMRIAEKQLEKIRNPTTEDEKALLLDNGILDIIDSRIRMLDNQQWTVNVWRLQAGHTGASKPAPFEPGRTIHQIYAEGVSLYDQLVTHLPVLRAEVDAFIVAGGEKKVGQELVHSLCAGYNRLAPMYRLWLRDIQELQNMREKEEEAMFADQMGTLQSSNSNHSQR